MAKTKKRPIELPSGTQTKIAAETTDRKYFIVTPQLVWALSRDCYDYTLWNVIKMVAGDHGECFLATPELAALAMMSEGKCSDSRKYLLDIGLLAGNLEKDPGYPQPVWHLRIPDLWPRNLAWREKLGDKLKDRIAYKIEQYAQAAENKRRVRAEAEKRRREKSLHLVKASKPSPGEEGVTPGEEGVTPGETKDIQKDIQKGDNSAYSYEADGVEVRLL